MPFEDAHKHTSDVFKKFVLKLQKLPKADPVEIVAFSALVVFIVTVLLLMSVPCFSCCHACCCNRDSDHKGRKIHVEPATQA